MSVSSAIHAQRQILRRVQQCPIGDGVRSTLDSFYSGKMLSSDERRYVIEAINVLEEKGKIDVVRDGGVIVQITEPKPDEDDQQRVVPPPVVIQKPTIQKFALLVVLHELLKGEADRRGVIHNNIGLRDYVKYLHKVVSARYDVSYDDVYEVFGAMAQLDLRGHARSLRGVGMKIAPVTLCTDDVGNQEAVMELKAQLARANSELAGVYEENGMLTEENERLMQANQDLRRRNDVSAQLKHSVRSALVEAEKN